MAPTPTSQSKKREAGGSPEGGNPAPTIKVGASSEGLTPSCVQQEKTMAETGGSGEGTHDYPQLGRERTGSAPHLTGRGRKKNKFKGGKRKGRTLSARVNSTETRPTESMLPGEK